MRVSSGDNYRPFCESAQTSHSLTLQSQILALFSVSLTRDSSTRRPQLKDVMCVRRDPRHMTSCL